MKISHPNRLKGFHSRRIGVFHDRYRAVVNRYVLWGGAILCFIVIAGFIPYPFPMLRDKVDRVCDAVWGGTCSVKSIALVPWSGISIAGLTSSKTERGTTLRLSIPHAGISFRVLPLLLNGVFAGKFPHEKRTAGDVSGWGGGAQQGPRRIPAHLLRKALNAIPFAGFVSSLYIEKGEITADEERRGNPLVDVRGIDVVLRVAGGATPSASGKIECTSIRVCGLWDVKALRAKIDITDQVLFLSNCKADFYRGTMTASGKADLDRGMLEFLHCELFGACMKDLYRDSRVGQGECKGRLDGTLDLEKGALNLDSLTGRGAVAVSNLEALNLPLQNSLIVLIALPNLKDITFSHVTTDVVVRNGKIYTPDISGVGAQLDVTSEGWVAFNGELSEKCKAVFSTEFSGGLPSLVARSLDDAGNGRKSFSCNVSGTFKDPRLTIDQKIVNRAVNNIINDVAKGLENFFK